jgi:hypothetical protein
MLNQLGGEQHCGVGTATARDTGVCRLSDDRVVADVKREAAPEECCGEWASPCF